MGNSEGRLREILGCEGIEPKPRNQEVTHWLKAAKKSDEGYPFILAGSRQPGKFNPPPSEVGTKVIRLEEINPQPKPKKEFSGFITVQEMPDFAAALAAHTQILQSTGIPKEDIARTRQEIIETTKTRSQGNRFINFIAGLTHSLHLPGTS